MIENIIVTFIVAIGGPIAVLWFKYKINNKSKKKTKESLRNHIFFSDIRYMVDVTSWKLDFQGKETRSAMVRKFIRIMLKSYERNYRDLVDKVIDKKDLSACDYNNTLTNVVVKYERESREANIPITFINKFSSWHTPRLKQIKETTEFITRSEVYDTSIEKTSAVLSIVGMLLHITLMDAVETLNNMNGELDNILENMSPLDFK